MVSGRKNYQESHLKKTLIYWHGDVCEDTFKRDCENIHNHFGPFQLRDLDSEQLNLLYLMRRTNHEGDESVVVNLNWGETSRYLSELSYNQRVKNNLTS